MKVVHSHLNTHSNVIESWAFFFLVKNLYSEYYKELSKQL